MKLSKYAAVPVLVALSAAIALSPVTASAKGGMKASFEEIDADGNGAITEAELAAHATSRFNDADTDGDGFLTAEEMTAVAKARSSERAAKRIERMISHRDADGDGKLSAAELAPSEERQAKRFERADKDGNGEISQAEFEAAQEKRGGHRGHKGKKRDG